jgi:hypothetical protein
MDVAGLLVILLIIGLAWLLWDTYGNGEVEYVKSTVDGKEYLVRSLPDKKEAANLMAQIVANLQKLVSYLETNQSKDERTVRIIKNFNSDAISEGSENAKYTSYSVNKGEKIVFCLRSRDKNNKLMDSNTMTFVALHELSHICTESIGHDETFWENFKWLLQNAVKIGVYKEQDFKKAPVEYCGIQITDSPLYH